jgi:hypothetical protein
MSTASSLCRLVLGCAAVALLSAQAPILPMPNATPTPMAVPQKAKPPAKPGAKGKPGAKPERGPKPKTTAKPASKPKPGTKPTVQAKPNAKPAPSPSPRRNVFPAGTPSPAVFPAATPRFGLSPTPRGVFPAGTPSPGKFPGALPSYRGFGSPPPTPTPPPPHGVPGAVLVHWGGLSTQAVTLRYGQKLKLRGAKGFNRTLHLFVVNPNEHFTQTNATPFARFPAKLTHAQKLAWLGDAGHFVHLHWAIARGPALDIDPEAFLALYDRITGGGTGYLWPMRFLFYVAVVPPAGRGSEVYYKLAVTITR